MEGMNRVQLDICDGQVQMVAVTLSVLHDSHIALSGAMVCDTGARRST
jgi:hypothetical protein